MPTRVVFDSLSELRLLAGNPLRYRRQILALKQFFVGRQWTVLLLDDMTSNVYDLQVQSIAHGAVRLETLNPEYGAERRPLIVVRYRGVRVRGGYHDYVIRNGGLEVFPRLVAREHRAPVMRYFEARGQLRQAISVVKKRGGMRERTIREFHMREGGVTVGAPLREFRGILSGAPAFEGHNGQSADGSSS